ncbi:MAG: sporulation protein YqfD, partial [Clostridia bacterium]|nr:sporulation protein YqfD [Clostridia bacterium]
MKAFKNKITITGLNLSRVVQEIESMGIALFDIFKPDSKTLTFCTYAKDCSKVVAYLKKKCYNISNIDKIGSNLFFFNLKRHFVSISILFLFVFTLSYLGSTCTKIVVYGPTDLVEVAYKTLDDYGKLKGAFKKNISLDKVENALCVAIPQIKYAFASFKGTQLIIQLEPLTVADKIVDNTTPQDLISSCDGVVERILVINGTPQVKVGDKIHKGQVLIKGQNELKDGTTQRTKAMGQVWATVEVSSSVIFTPNTICLEPTGNFVKRHRIKVLNYFTRFSKSFDYAYYTIDTIYSTLYPFGIVVEYQTVYEMQQVTKTLTIKDCLQDLQNQAYLQLKQKLQDLKVTD